ncbi:MAG TPA: hypothetical protein VGM91_22440 [Conexibacter sp.]|jgi:hypothetical protein
MLTTVLMLAPAIALLALLLSGRAPGEELILRLRKRATAPRRRRSAAAPPLAPTHAAPFVRLAGRISASALAMRPPPRLVMSHR